MRKTNLTRGLFAALTTSAILLAGSNQPALAAEIAADGTAEARDPEIEKQVQERLEWFKDAKFGMFIHWGTWANVAGVWKGKALPQVRELLTDYGPVCLIWFDIARFGPSNEYPQAFHGIIRELQPQCLINSRIVEGSDGEPDLPTVVSKMSRRQAYALPRPGWLRPHPKRQPDREPRQGSTPQGSVPRTVDKRHTLTRSTGP